MISAEISSMSPLTRPFCATTARQRTVSVRSFGGSTSIESGEWISFQRAGWVGSVSPRLPPHIHLIAFDWPRSARGWPSAVTAAP